jgi:leishmanolysin
VEAKAGTPVRADLVLYVTAADGGVAACGDAARATSASRASGGATAVLAAAGGACEVDNATGRPVAGAVNLCPARLALLTAQATASASSIDTLVQDLTHEMLHALAFSEGLYARFRAGADGAPAVAPGPDGGLLVKMPAVLAEGRRHYGCPTLAGVPLETEGGNGTARTHWQLRALNGELMTGTVITGQRPVLSNFTLAFLEGTGFGYLPQYAAAAPLAWGAGAGCDFVTARSCVDAGSKADAFFCKPAPADSGVDARCTRDGSAVGACKPLPLTRADERCFAVQPYSNWACRDASLATEDRARWGYAFGPSARCVSGGSVPWTRVDKSGRVQYTQDQAMPACFTLHCNASGALHVDIEGADVACPDGQTIDLSTIKGVSCLRLLQLHVLTHHASCAYASHRCL